MRHRIQADLPEDSNLEQLLFDGLGRHLRDKNGRARRKNQGGFTDCALAIGAELNGTVRDEPHSLK
jgi:hypothetical protein